MEAPRLPEDGHLEVETMPAKSYWSIGDAFYQAAIYPYAEWEAMDPEDRPPGAQEHKGIGFATISLAAVMYPDRPPLRVTGGACLQGIAADGRPIPR